MADHPLRIFSGSAHPALAQEIADLLNVPLGNAKTTRMPDSEIHVMINEVVRGHHIFFIQPCPSPVNEYLMETLLYLDAFRRASAHSVTLVIPYFPYARQERMARGREAISARVVANLLEGSGAARVIYMDIHNRAIQGFFNIPVDPLTALPILADHIRSLKLEKPVIVSPDVGRASLAGRYAEYLGYPLVLMHKRRETEKDTKTTHVVGDIEGRQPVIIDDVISGGSVLRQIDALYENGAEGKAFFAITHPQLQDSAIRTLDEDDRIAGLITTNTIPIPPEKRHPKITQLSVASLLTEIICRVHGGMSISDMLVKT